MEIRPLPESLAIVPSESPDTGPLSFCTIISDCGPGITLWSVPGSRRSSPTDSDVPLQILPDAPVVIGRQFDGEGPYPDPRYQPSPIIPGEAHAVLQRDGTRNGLCVSRAHFSLHSHPAGMVVVNGVRCRGGGIRPPRQGTQLLAPQSRMLQRSEELVIERGAQITISLPNGTRLTIKVG